jgi:hypothetical protein
LLISLSVILVGIAVTVGITMFQDNANSLNKDAVTIDLANLGSRAQVYYRRPYMLGGGQGSFAGVKLADLTSKPKNENGTYRLKDVSENLVKLEGKGTERDSNGDPIKVEMNVFADTMYVVVNN